jgi:hypothetical protein
MTYVFLKLNFHILFPFINLLQTTHPLLPFLLSAQLDKMLLYRSECGNALFITR